MLVIPQTEVRLLNAVPLTNSYEHQMDFSSQSSQSSYFIGKTAYSFLDFTYVKEDGTIKVPRGRDSLYACNYLMFKNTDFSGKWFYAFITKLEYINPETTKVHFEIDVFQTWQFDYTMKPSFVEREHQKRWNADGSPVINTIDEGLNYGDEYETAYFENWQPFNDVFFLVVAAKNAMHGGSADKGKVKPVVNGSPQPLSYYIHPFRLDGTSPRVTVSGMDITISSISDFLLGLYTIEGAQNNIVSIYVTEHIGVNPGYSGGTMSFDGVKISHALIQDGTKTVNTLYAEKIVKYESYMKSFGDKYLGYDTVTESKLLMYPYTVTILTDFKGNRVQLKNEYIDGDSLLVTCRGSLGVSNKVAYGVSDYKTRKIVSNADKDIVSLETALINTNANDVPIITDMLSAYLQGNRNQIENQKNALLFNGLFGAFGNILTANAGGVIAQGGSAYFEVQGILAKTMDLQNTPPQISQMGGNTAFDYGNNIKGLYVVKQQIMPEYRKKLTDYFKMYGYKSHEVKTPNLKSRAHFNYIKTVGANVTGNVPQDDLTRIKQMFDNGVTLWHTSDVGNYSLANEEV